MMNNNEMNEMMENIFEEYCADKQLDWWEVFDSDLMEEVNYRIAQALGCSVEELEDNEVYNEWTFEMAMDL